MAGPVRWKMGSERDGYNSADEEAREALALRAADRAERVPPYFEEAYPDDDRPRKAIEAARLDARRSDGGRGERERSWLSTEGTTDAGGGRTRWSGTRRRGDRSTGVAE